MDTITYQRLLGVPEVLPGDDLCELVLRSLDETGLTLEDEDVLVVAQKIVSKAEGRLVKLDELEPSPRAFELAQEVDKDPRLVEAILSESNEVVRHRKGVLIVEHRLGLVLANAGIDQSNVSQEDGERLLLLPIDPDASANDLRTALKEKTGKSVGIIINDSLGRAWRIGTVGIAIGVSGVVAVEDLRGNVDRFGRELKVSEEALADELAAAASILQGQGNEGTPVVLVRGFRSRALAQTAKHLVRDRDFDLFR